MHHIPMLRWFIGTIALHLLCSIWRITQSIGGVDQKNVLNPAYIPTPPRPPPPALL